jgi:hypothetical protein
VFVSKFLFKMLHFGPLIAEVLLIYGFKYSVKFSWMDPKSREIVGTPKVNQIHTV